MNDMTQTIVPKYERWKSIDGYPEYKVSSLGRIKRVIASKRYHVGYVLKPWLNNKGYFIVQLCGAIGHRRALVSRLVCEAFRGPAPSDKHEVAHNDGKPTNNRYRNLRWATRAENMADCIKHGTQINGSRHFTATNPEKIARGDRHGRSVLTEIYVRAIRSAKRVKGSGVLLAAHYGVSPGVISMVRNRKIWKHVN